MGPESREGGERRSAAEPATSGGERRRRVRRASPNENGTESPVITRVRELIGPIASDLGLDVYDVEQRGGVLRLALDTPPGSDGGVTLDTLALASRLMSRELDHNDPIPGRYTLEVTSPGVERALRTPEHFRREVGKVVAIRLSDVGHDDRRVTGTLVGADDTAATVRVDGPDGAVERAISYSQIDRAHTVFEWGPAARKRVKVKETP
jgi:ribosome maturation factor RimP